MLGGRGYLHKRVWFIYTDHAISGACSTCLYGQLVRETRSSQQPQMGHNYSQRSMGEEPNILSSPPPTIPNLRQQFLYPRVR